MKSYKENDIVIVRKKFTDDWGDSWLDEMDEYIGRRSKVVKVNGDIIYLLLLENFVDDSTKFSKSYVFPIKSLDNRLEKLERILSEDN